MEKKRKEEILLDYLYGDLGPTEREEVAEQVRSDPEWEETFRSLEQSRGMLEADTDPEIPAGLHEAVMSRVSTPGPIPGVSVFRSSLGPFLRSLLPLVTAALAASLALGLTVAASAPMEGGTLMAVIVLAVISGGVYHVLFQSVFEPGRRLVRVPHPGRPAGFVHVELRQSVLYAFLALAVFFAVALVTPNPAPFETRALYLALSRNLPVALAYFLPAFYAAVGCLVAGFFLGWRSHGNAGDQGVLMGLFAGVLMVLDLVAYHLIETESSLLYLLTWCVSSFLVAAACAWLGARLYRAFARS